MSAANQCPLQHLSVWVCVRVCLYLCVCVSVCLCVCYKYYSQYYHRDHQHHYVAGTSRYRVKR